MILQDKYFPTYMKDPVSQIPSDHFAGMLLELVTNAMFYMNTENDGATTAKMVKGINDMIVQDPVYKLLPLYLVIETFHNGSLGQLGGTTKFGIRNVNIWLQASKEKFQKVTADQKSRDDQRRKAEEARAYKSVMNRSSLFGSALDRKLEWQRAGLLSDADYDRCTLDKIVSLMEQGIAVKEIFPRHITGR